FKLAERPEVPVPDLKEASADDMIALVYRHLSEEKVVRLSLSAPSMELLPAAKLNKSLAEVVRHSKTSCMHYESIQGNPVLRKQVARLCFNWGGNISEEDVITTQGCMEALVFCLKAVTEPGDTVAIESPTYFGIFNALKAHGLKVLEIPAHPNTGINLNLLEDALENFTIKACLVTSNFSNPTGALMPDESKERLVKMLSKKNIPLIEDDIYGEMYFGSSRPHTCKSFDKKGLVLYCSSVSKSLAPGYRVGWCLPGKFFEQVLKTKLVHTVSSATPTQAAIGHFFETGRYDLHMRHLRKKLHVQSLQYIKAISEYFPEDTHLTAPKGGYVLWIELTKTVNATDLFHEAMKADISIAPGQIFSTDGRFTNFIRISFGYPYDAVIDKSLRILGKIARKLANK
ncbi:MAG: transcriptional regulator, GntR family with aminotransferase domain, partial [Flaviaesturariibacter sp.]|nr:transcriptional regulator, GntR family with aminotransferase domain [Flaviaesturariibacter sp.]